MFLNAEIRFSSFLSTYRTKKNTKFINRGDTTKYNTMFDSLGLAWERIQYFRIIGKLRCERMKKKAAVLASVSII